MISMLKNRGNGFTLIEIIITLVITAIFGAAMYSYFGTSITKSAVPLIRLQQSSQLQMVMENIVADYKKNYTSDLNGLQTKIGSGNDYGQYTVVKNGFIKFVSNSEQDATGSDPKSLLKVTIKSSNTGETLTVIFSLY